MVDKIGTGVRVKTASLVILVCLGLVSCASGSGGLVNGALRPCPGSPNCVSSEMPDRDLEPLASSVDGGWERLRKAVISLGGSIEREEPGYLHATFRSRVFGFVDDLECRQDGDVIQVRSASRLGWWDLGANRRRVERLREVLGKTGQSL